MRITDDIAKALRTGVRCCKCWNVIDGKTPGTRRNCSGCTLPPPKDAMAKCPACLEGYIRPGRNLCTNCSNKLRNDKKANKGR